MSSFSTPLMRQDLGKAAFLLNANAKSVSASMVRALVDLVPTGDLYLSRTIDDSRRFVRTILDRGYSQVFSGGGDGTLVNTLSTLQQILGEHSGSAPHVGVLKLGTGNAVARELGAKSPLLDVHHIVNGGRLTLQRMNMVRCDDQMAAPFAGIGYDGEVLNDYVALKKAYQGTALEKVVNSVFGYVWAGLGKTAVRHLSASQPWIRITSNKPAIKMCYEQGRDVAVELPSNSVLYEGPAAIATVGSIRCWGYGFQMFPHLQNHADKMQLRLYSGGLLPVLCHIPSIWQGTYRHHRLNDFLVEQVNIESEVPLPYQIAGDAKGFRKQVSFTLEQNAVSAISLDKQRLPYRRTALPLLLPAR